MAGARDAEAARRWLDDVRHRRLAIDGDDLVGRGPDGPGRRRGARPGDGGDARRARARTREEQLAAALGSPSIRAMALEAPFRWEGDHVAADLPGARALFTTRRGGVSTGAVRLAQPRPADRRRRRQRRREPAPRGGGDGPPARALPLRQAGPRRDGAAGDRAARPATAARRRGRPGDRAARATRRSSSSPTARRSLLAADGAVAALHCGWRGAAAGIVARGHRGAARARRRPARSPR